MKLRLIAFVSLALGSADALVVSGEVGGAPPRARVGAWLVDPAGRPVEEIASVPINEGRFSITLPPTAPPARASWPLTAENLTWPGLTGQISAPGGVRTAELQLRVYADANSNGRRDGAEELLESTARVGKANLALVYVDQDATVKAERGFQASLRSGWNVLLVELGKTLAASVKSTVDSVRLNLTP